MTFARSAAECAEKADVVAIVTPWAEFKNLSPDHVAPNGTRRTVLDCWRLLQREIFEEAADWKTLGLGESAAETEFPVERQAVAANAD